MLIAVSGKEGTGKTTVGNYLKSKHNFTPIAFAEPLKNVVSVLFDWDLEILKAENTETRTLRENLPHRVIGGKEYDARKALQYIGTDVFRTHVDENVWVDIAKIKIQGLLANGTNVVVTDCRFVNEIDLVKSLNGKILCLARKQSDLEILKGSHTSESDFLNRITDLHVIRNEATLNDLYMEVDKIIIGK